jgi:titin
MGSYNNGTPTIYVPASPTGLTATAGNAQATLNWTAPSNNGGAAVDYYLINENGNPLPNNFTSTSTTITGLTNGQSYSFTVAAHNSAGMGTATSAVSATPSSSATNVSVPGPVTGVKVTTGVNKIMLDWTLPSTGGTPTTIMVFIFTSSPMPSMLIANLSSSATEYIDSNAVNGTTYYCWIVPGNSAGTGASADSGAVTVGAVANTGSSSNESSMLIIAVVAVITIVAVVLVVLFIIRKNKSPPTVHQSFQQQPEQFPAVGERKKE